MAIRASRTVGSPAVRVWALNKIIDRSGNSIEFVYEEDTSGGSYRPFEINYGRKRSSWHVSRDEGRVRVRDRHAPRSDLFLSVLAQHARRPAPVHEFKRLDRIDVDRHRDLDNRAHVRPHVRGDGWRRQSLAAELDPGITRQRHVAADGNTTGPLARRVGRAPMSLRASPSPDFCAATSTATTAQTSFSRPARCLAAALGATCSEPQQGSVLSSTRTIPNHNYDECATPRMERGRPT